MGRFIEANFGQGGDAQRVLAKAEEVPFVPSLQDEGDHYSVLVEHPAATLEGSMLMRGTSTKSDKPEQDFLNAYTDAFSGVDTVTDLVGVQRIEDGRRGFVSLEFEMRSGDRFTSVGKTPDQAVRDAVTSRLVLRDY